MADPNEEQLSKLRLVLAVAEKNGNQLFIDNIKRDIEALERGDESPIIAEYLTDEERSCAEVHAESCCPCLLRGLLLRSTAPSRRPGPWRRAIGSAQRRLRQKMAFFWVRALAAAVETGWLRRARG